MSMFLFVFIGYQITERRRVGLIRHSRSQKKHQDKIIECLEEEDDAGGEYVYQQQLDEEEDIEGLGDFEEVVEGVSGAGDEEYWDENENVSTNENQIHSHGYYESETY